MKLEIQPIKNANIYKNLKSLNNDKLVLNNKDNWEEFFLQNVDRKRHASNPDSNEKYLKKRTMKNIKGFETLIDQIKYNKKIDSGFFLDYSSFVNIFQYFKNEEEIFNYILDLREARGEKPINQHSEAIEYLVSEGVVISKVSEIFIEQNEWNKFKSEYEIKSTFKPKKN